MKNKILFILVLVLFCVKNVSASELCSSNGYTVVTINGIFTNLDGAIYNKDKIARKFLPTYNNQKLTFDYLYNPTHLAGVGDLIDTVQQGFFDQKNDYDLVEMLNDASAKVTTQKLLLVAHSQGNFYANNFYDKVTDQEGGVPSQSIGMYGVASPANRVAGKGKYLTSSTDAVINKTRLFGILDVLKANADINLQNEIGSNGHSFSDVYLKYQGDKIVSDIKSSLNKLEDNDEQDAQSPCIYPPELSMFHKAQGVVLAVADPTATIVKTGIVGAYDTGVYIANSAKKAGLAIGNFFYNTALAIGKTFNNLSANVIASLPDENNLSTLPVNILDSATENNSQDNSSQEQERVPEIAETAEATPPPSVTPEVAETPVIVPVPASVPVVVPPPVFHGGGGRGAPAPQTEPELPPVENPIVPPVEDPIPPVEEPVPPPLAEEEIIPVIPPLPPEEEIIPPPPTPVPDEIPAPNTFIVDKDTALPAGEYNYDNLIVTNNAVLTLEGDPTSLNDFKGVKINAVNITIDAGSSISADGKGYGPDQGPGAGNTLSAISNPGASYGGISLSNPDSTYGSATQPIDLGSGGTTNGGGAVRIIVSDTFINNGNVSANGNTSSSGGSIYVTAKNIEGSGIFSANGGNLFAGNYFKSPGGGGRIAIYYQASLFSGNVEAKGGCGQYDGMTMSCSENGTVGLFDEFANNLYVNAFWRFQKKDSPFNFNNIFLTGAKVAIDDGVEITAHDIVLDKASTLTLSGEEIINANTLSLLGNSSITVIPEKILSLKVLNLNIENGSTISADGKGYIIGPGSPDVYYQAGASYGGMGGGTIAKPVYGSETEPVDFGSGTENNRGGGAIRLVVDNNFKNDGTVSVNGISQRVSGGSIYVNAGNMSGVGIFQASGGNSSDPYGPIAGGGGRITIYYKTSDFSGTATALAGTYCYSGCNPAGGVGSVKIIDESIPDPEPAPVPEPAPDPIPDPILDITPPTITSYTLNGVADNITIDPFTNPISLVFTANKNVDWVSIKIEKEEDKNIYKYFKEGKTCVDGTNICEKNWNGLLAGDVSAPNGIYKIKVRIRELDDKDKDYDFVSPYTITVEVSPTPGVGEF